MLDFVVKLLFHLGELLRGEGCEVDYWMLVSEWCFGLGAAYFAVLCRPRPWCTDKGLEWEVKMIDGWKCFCYCLAGLSALPACALPVQLGADGSCRDHPA